MAASHGQAAVNLMLGDLRAAIADYSAALQMAPPDAWTLLLRGNVRALSGDLAAAVADYGAALQLDPANVVASTRRGDAHQAAGDLEAAVADYTAAITRDPRHSLAYLGRADAYATASAHAAARSQLRQYAGAAITDYERYLELRPDAPDLARVEEALADLRSRMSPR